MHFIVLLSGTDCTHTDLCLNGLMARSGFVGLIIDLIWPGIISCVLFRKQVIGYRDTCDNETAQKRID